MKMKIVTIICSLIFLSGCRQSFEAETKFTATIIQVDVARELLIVDDVNGTRYDIPVSDTDDYEKGQHLRITVLSNSDQDIWSSKNLKFKIDKLD